MCGRYYIDDKTLSEIKKVVRSMDQIISQKRFGVDIHPSEYAPVIMGENSGLKLTEQKWGYPGINNKGIIFNARAESVMEKKMFNNGINKNRVIVPVTSFYEWNKSKEKNTFSRGDGNVLYLAGFYDTFEGENRFVILTTAANDSMIKIHDRMPLVMESNQVEDWICNRKRTEELLCQIPILLKRIAEYEQQTLF